MTRRVKLDAVVERAFKRLRDRELARDLRKLVGTGDASEPWVDWAWVMAKNLRARSKTTLLLTLVLVLVVACGGRSEGAPDAHAPLECVEEPWTPEWCDARSSPQFVVVCEGGERGELGTDGVWSGAPYAACAPAELEPGVMAWCCWGRN